MAVGMSNILVQEGTTFGLGSVRLTLRYFSCLAPEKAKKNL